MACVCLYLSIYLSYVCLPCQRDGLFEDPHGSTLYPAGHVVKINSGDLRFYCPPISQLEFTTFHTVFLSFLFLKSKSVQTCEPGLPAYRIALFCCSYFFFCEVQILRYKNKSKQRGHLAVSALFLAALDVSLSAFLFFR